MRCAGALLLLLTLLARTARAVSAIFPKQSLAHCPNWEGGIDDDVDVAALPNCTLLAHLSRKELNIKRATRASETSCYGVAVRERDTRVLLYWGSEPGRAAAALLRVQLRDILHYCGVYTACGPHTTQMLADYVGFSAVGSYDDLVVGISTAWDPNAVQYHGWEPEMGKESGLAGPRLNEFGKSSVPASCHLHARLAPAARALAACRQYQRWTFYTSAVTRALCGFDDPVLVNTSALVVYAVPGCAGALLRLRQRANAAVLPLDTHPVNRLALLSHLHTTNRSILFLDYDIWEGETTVSVVESPPCGSDYYYCQQDIDSAIAMRVADTKLLEHYAPQFFHSIYNFMPHPKTLRAILERAANGVNIEEAACEWSLQHKTELFKNLIKYNTLRYWIGVYFCSEDVDFDTYKKKVVAYFGAKINNDIKKNVGFTLLIIGFYINCSDANELSEKIQSRQHFGNIASLIGLIAQVGPGIERAERAAAGLPVPLVLVGEAPDSVESSSRAWRVTGRPRHLVLALQRFILDAKWTRLAVLSQPTTLANEYYVALRNETKCILGNYKIPPQFENPKALYETLGKIKSARGRIVFINADMKYTELILSAALKLNMNFANGFVWIARDWWPNNTTHNMTLFTVSFWSRGELGIPNSSGRSDLRERLRKTKTKWAPLTASFTDAMLTLTQQFSQFYEQHPNMRQDLRNTRVMRILNENLSRTKVKGLTQDLTFKEQTIEEALVFVDEWSGGTPVGRLASWRVNASLSGLDAVLGDYMDPTVAQRLPRDDGALPCLVRSGDAFDPECQDAMWISTVVLLPLIPFAVLLARHLLQRRIALLVAKRELELKAGRQQVVSTLAPYLVKRNALELREELGMGRFGHVSLALLRTPLASPRYVAAKALHDNATLAEEGDFLREARIIASLEHKHIVRLMGVCIEGGPPLVLMELAFFGDLLEYLRARRHLVEATSCEQSDANGAGEEAAHVSSEALTRLASEAAAALAYLCSRGVVHRDVRAANCLVDARRSLKLADFGLARETVASSDGSTEYACRRRGLFPVLWMAPESLAHGVFSAASDVWALGVLVLELVTLGARPYGSMPPLHVLRYVASGGRPPLPLDATPHTRELTRLCWHRSAEQRPSAEEVVAYLAAWPRALRPALLPAHDEPADADSGFGESPSTELLPPESPVDSFGSIRLDVYDTTHS